MAERIRNIGIVAHIDSGKTTITERMLKICGKIHKLGEVHDGEATMDFMKEEKERGITIGSAATYFEWKRYEFNLIDTPGHVDFTAEVERSCRVLDGAILAIDSVAGAQAQSETVNRQLNKYGVPRLAFINKMDRVGADFDQAVLSLKKNLSLDAVPIQIPVGEGPEFSGFVDLVEMEQVMFPQDDDDPAAFERLPIDPEVLELAETRRAELLDALSLHSDELTEVLLEGHEPDSKLVRKALREVTIAGLLVPVLLGSALHNRGVPALLDAAVDYLPNPLDMGAVEGAVPKTEEPISFAPDSAEPLGAIVFKTVHYSTGDLTFIRVFSGTLHAGKGAFNPRLGKHERVGQIYRIHAGSRESIECAQAGQIVACVGLKKSATGDTLCAKENQIAYGSTTFANPVISMAVEPSTSADRDRLGEVLWIISREDPTFRVATDEETGQTIMSGMGELHLEVVVHRIRDDFRLHVITGKPRVSYRQTLKRPGTVNCRHIKQTGGSGQYAVAKIEFEPIEGEEFEFEDTIKGGAITAEFIKSLRKGIEDYCVSGGKRAAKIQGLRATVVDGKMHEVDSSQLAFYACGVKSAREAEESCGLTLLEPVMRVVVTT
ncbi:MAG: elongation factor G, partial [Planctomycetota bacterium]|nr:elongation factor G [Planctomycetota bacterium]